MSEAWGLGEETVAYAAARGDLDGDGDERSGGDGRRGPDGGVSERPWRVGSRCWWNCAGPIEQPLRHRRTDRLESGGITQLRQMLAARVHGKQRAGRAFWSWEGEEDRPIAGDMAVGDRCRNSRTSTLGSGIG